MKLEQQIESILFYKNEPQSIKQLCKILNIEDGEIKEALNNLQNSLKDRGINLILTRDEAVLATHPEARELIEQLAKDEMSRDIGKAGLETLAIILYNGPMSRREIDYIRGVNSTFILRNLGLRGLIEREPDPKDQRTWKYKSSLGLLAHIGLSRAEDLPEFENFKKEISKVKEAESNGEQ